MSSRVSEPWWSRYKWLLPGLLAVIIILVVAGFLLANKAREAAKAHPTPTATSTLRPTPTPVPTHAPKPRPRPTPTAVPKPTRRLRPTATPKPPPTSRPAPTSTPTPLPRPTPTSTSTPTPTPTPPTPTPTATLAPIPTVVGLSLGYIYRPEARIRQIQTAATAGQHGFEFYLTPLLVLQNTLPSYGFTGDWQIIQPHQPAPTPTVTPKPYVTQLGIPAMKFIVRYQQHTYEVVLEQLAGKAHEGHGGIWLIWQLGPQLT